MRQTKGEFEMEQNRLKQHEVLGLRNGIKKAVE